MSQYSKNAPPTPPKTERWLLVMALAFVPVIVALFVPDVARIPLLAVSGLTFVAAFAMMIRHARENRDNESLRRLVHSDSD